MKAGEMKNKIPNFETNKTLVEDVTNYPRYKMMDVRKMLNNFGGKKTSIENNPDWKGWEVYNEIKCMLESGQECPSLKELGQVFDLCHTTISRHVNKLIDNGYLVRDDSLWGRNIMLTNKVPDHFPHHISYEYNMISYIINEKVFIDKRCCDTNNEYLYSFEGGFIMSFDFKSNEIVIQERSKDYGLYKIFSFVFDVNDFTELFNMMHHKVQIEFFKRIGYLE